MGKFSDIMEHLHPKVFFEKVDIPHDTARGKYCLKSSVVSSYDEFKKIVIDYCDHHYKEIYGSSLPPEILFSNASKILDSAGGLKNFVVNSMTGDKGGLGTALTQISEGFKKELKLAWFNEIITRYLDPFSYEDMLEVMGELKKKLAEFDPKIEHVSPAAMAVDYKDHLWQYIHELSTHKNVWKR